MILGALLLLPILRFLSLFTGLSSYFWWFVYWCTIIISTLIKDIIFYFTMSIRQNSIKITLGIIYLFIAFAIIYYSTIYSFVNNSLQVSLFMHTNAVFLGLLKITLQESKKIICKSR